MNILWALMSSSMWYIMQSIQSKYSLSERLIRTIAAIRSFPHDNVEDLIRGVSVLYWWRVLWEVKREGSWGIVIDSRFAALTQRKMTRSFYSPHTCINLTMQIHFPCVLLPFPSPFHFVHLIFFFRKYVLDDPSLTFFVKSLSGYDAYGIQQAQSLLHVF